LFRKDNTAHSGGCLLYTPSHLRPQRLLHLEFLLPETLWLEIKDKRKSSITCTVYRRPHYSIDFCEKLNINIERTLKNVNNVILVKK
jgi:hypothetical protein